MDYLGIPEEMDAKYPGMSFAPLLHGKSMAGRERIFMEGEYGPVRMIRTPEWKYVHRYLSWEGMNELYNLTEDPSEHNNLYGKPGYEKIIELLQKELFDWYKEFVDPRYDGSTVYCKGHGQTDLIYPRKTDDREMFRIYQGEWEADHSSC